jgi:hypothetical protein
MRRQKKDISPRNLRILSVRLADLMLRSLLSKNALYMGGNTSSISVSSAANRQNSCVEMAITIVTHAMTIMPKFNQLLVWVLNSAH